MFVLLFDGIFPPDELPKRFIGDGALGRFETIVDAGRLKSRNAHEIVCLSDKILTLKDSEQ